MEEILKELIKTTLEKGPQNKQFYSNLSITKPIHDQAEIQLRLGDAITFLQSKFSSGKGFQSKLYTSRNCAIESARVCNSFQLPENTIEVLTSVLALDLLFNHLDNESIVTPNFQEIICNFPEEIQDALHNLIVPSCGISTFNLFKQVPELSPVPSSPSPIHHNEPLCHEEFDSGNDSPISMYSNALNPDSSENVANIVSCLPDDINTSMITLYVLIHQGILQVKPVESVLKWIISNVFSFESEPNDQLVASSESSVTFPTFITRQGSSDPVGVANLLNLLYLLDISHEALLNAAEEFLVMTLKDTLSKVNEEVTTAPEETSTSSSEIDNSLGNTQPAISSEDNEQECSSRSNTTEDEASQKHHQYAFILQHHSPESLLYFLSRALAIPTSTAYNGNSTNCRRPYISQMQSLLLELLDARLGTTMNTCDIAMRILAAVYLGVVNVSNNTSNLSSGSSTNGNHHHHERHERYCSSSLTCGIDRTVRINNLLQKEFELLVSLQNDVDGSWQADSIIQVGFTENDNDIVVQSKENCNDSVEDYDSSKETEIIGYLGGKELATLFAVKAISVYLSMKKGNFVCDEGEAWCDTDNANNVDPDVGIHQLY